MTGAEQPFHLWPAGLDALRYVWRWASWSRHGVRTMLLALAAAGAVAVLATTFLHSTI